MVVLNARGGLARRQFARFSANCRVGCLQPSGNAGEPAQNAVFKAYVIEIDDEAVGIAARDESGYRFHAAEHAFNALDGRLFPSLREAAAAARVARRQAVATARPLPAAGRRIRLTAIQSTHQEQS
jgi:hypothetical protein